MSEKVKKIVVLILAAGESKRMGVAKQNLPFGRSTMLNHIKEHLNLNIVERTFIVLGAYADEIIERCKLDQTEYFVFDDWKEGMGSSLAYACSRIFELDDFDGILITLSDLPLVSAEDYSSMIKMFYASNDIVATQTGETLGVPALFGKDFFNDLKSVNGARGAKSVIAKNTEHISVYSNPKAAVDIDTKEGYSDFLKRMDI